MVDCLQKLSIIFKITENHHFRGEDNAVLIDMLMKINQHFKMHVFFAKFDYSIIIKKKMFQLLRNHIKTNCGIKC